MCKSLTILVVEDDENVTNSYQRKVQGHNFDPDKEFEFQIDIVSNKNHALEKLSHNDYDGAIIDLDLTGNGGNDTSGIEVIKNIQENSRFPIFIISGTTHNLDDDRRIQNDFYKVVSRDEDFDFIKEFSKIHSTGIVELLKRKGKIENYINEIFWKHLSGSMKPWIEDYETSNDKKQKSLLRYFIFHLQEYLDIDDQEGCFNDYYPSEYYISKPIKKKIFTGDIFIDNKNEKFVVITPACDFSNDKADKIECLKITEAQEIENCFSLENMNKEQQNKVKNYLLNKIPRYHFLPNLYSDGEEYKLGILDFQDKHSFVYIELDKNCSENVFKRIATISQPFLKSLIERHASYICRQGAPNLSLPHLEKEFIRTNSNNK